MKSLIGKSCITEDIKVIAILGESRHDRTSLLAWENSGTKRCIKWKKNLLIQGEKKKSNNKTLFLPLIMTSKNNLSIKLNKDQVVKQMSRRIKYPC